MTSMRGFFARRLHGRKCPRRSRSAPSGRVTGLDSASRRNRFEISVPCAQRIRRRSDFAREAVRPRTIRPPTMMPPPRPVPGAMTMHVWAPRAAPQRASPSAWDCTSPSTATGKPESVTQTGGHRLPGPAGHDFVGVGDRSGLRRRRSRRADADAEDASGPDERKPP